jgi:hypothetical protein
MDWNGGISLFGVGLAIFTLVAPMIWHTFPRFVIVILFIVSVCLMLAWPMSAGSGLVRQYVKPPYGLLLMIVFGAIFGGIIFGTAYHFTEPSTESPPPVPRVEKSEEEILAQERTARSPKFDIKIYPFPGGVTPYKPPLKHYVLGIQNVNGDSVPVLDMRMEFNFRNIIAEVKPQVMLAGGGMFSVGGMKLYEKRKDGSTYAYEEKPLPTELSKKFSFSIQKATINKKVMNLNFVDLYVERWIEDTLFAADIIVNTAKGPQFLKSQMKSTPIRECTFMKSRARSLHKR